VNTKVTIAILFFTASIFSSSSALSDYCADKYITLCNAECDRKYMLNIDQWKACANICFENLQRCNEQSQNKESKSSKKKDDDWMKLALLAIFILGGLSALFSYKKDE
jgi:hypothetical protein